MVKRLRLDEIGYWSEVKLDIVRKYAAAYSVILSRQPAIRAHLYIDAFAGAGTHISKGTGQPVAGSPVNAMRIDPPFSELHFIDLDGTRTAELQRLAAGDPRVCVHQGDCMAANSPIEWTQATWNPVTGCDKISPGCAHCYAERMARRLHAMGQRNYVDGFQVRTHEHMLEHPMRWKRPLRIFVNSMSDLFHPSVPLEFIERVFDVMNRADWHQYQVLTKRSDRLRELSGSLRWRSNIWMGVSVENSRHAFRIDDLRRTPAPVKFLSLEPLLGPLPALDLTHIDWVIVGGESGPGARPMNPDWVVDIQRQCAQAGTKFFFKQWGGVFKNRTGRELSGRTWDEMPTNHPAIETAP